MMEVKDLTARTRKGKLLLDHVSFALEPGGCTGPAVAEKQPF